MAAARGSDDERDAVTGRDAAGARAWIFDGQLEPAATGKAPNIITAEH